MRTAWRRAPLSTLFCAVGLAAAVLPSLAAAGALPIPQQPGAPFRSTNANAVCGGDDCFLDFAVVPANKILQIDLINCIAVLKTTSFERGFLVTTKADDVQRAYVPAIEESNGGSALFIGGSLNGPIFFNAGEQMRVTVFDTANNDPHCYISGYLYSTP